jgi:hypothetical protein
MIKNSGSLSIPATVSLKRSAGKIHLASGY